MATDLFVLRAVLGLDTSEYEKGLERSGKQASTFGQMLKANLVTKGVEVAVAGMKKLGNAAVSMVKQSVDAFAEYEQLVGGVETLFKGSADTVKEYAQEAYRTAGLSANEYMETVTGFSASLIQSLGGDTKRAAELADMAIRDMSDNANKMGSDMGAIQNAYAGFAKQNYTMLDNLKLGYGGTKSEMDRLIKDAMKLNKNFKVATKTTKDGKKANQELSYSYADIVQAIHIVQENMEITGTTAKEAEHTISGSLNMVKASWKNLITAMAEGNTDKIDKMVDSFVDSAEKYADNLFPVVEKAIEGLATLIERLAPKIEEKLPGILKKITPTLVKVTGTLIKTIATVLTDPETINTIFEAAKSVVSAVFKQLKEENPELLAILGIGTGIKIAGKVGKAVDTGSKVLNWGKKLLGIGGGAKVASAAGKAAAAGKAGAAGGAAATGAGAVAGTAAIGAVAALGATAYYYDKKYQQAGEAQKREIEDILSMYQSLYETKGKEVADSWAKMTYAIDTSSLDLETAQYALMENIVELWGDVPTNIWDATKQGLDHYFGANGAGFGQLLYDAFVAPVKGKWETVKEVTINAWSGIKEFLHPAFDAIKTTASEKLENIKKAFHDNGEGIKGIVAAGWEVIKARYTFGFNVVDKLTGGKLTEIKDKITGTFTSVKNDAVSWGRDLWTNFTSGLEKGWTKVTSWLDGALNWFRARIHFSEPDEGPLSDFHTYAPDMMKLFAQGITDNAHLVTDAADKAFNLGPRIGALSGGQEFTTPVGGDQPTQINLILDDTVIGRVLLPILRNESNRVGVSLAGGVL